MNLFIILLVTCVALKVAYHYALQLFGWIKAGFPSFCRYVYIKGRAFYILISTAWPKKAPAIKQLNRSTLRSRLSRYISELEKGEHPNAQELWRQYNERVPESYRHIDRQNGGVYPLPLWMERVASFFTGWFIKAIMQFLALYLLVLMITALVSTPVDTQPYLTTQTTLQRHLDMSIEPCLSIRDGLCFLHTYDLLSLQTIETLSNRTVQLTPSFMLNQSLDMLIDEHDKILYPLDFSVPLNKVWQYTVEDRSGELTEWFASSPPSLIEEDVLETVQLRRYVNTERVIAPFLAQLHQEAGSATACICGLFLNIVSNVSFIYNRGEERWIVMREATIVRNNSFAELVASKIMYNERSRFFNKHKQWQRLVPEELIHYDSFVIEYIDEEMPTDDGLTDMIRIRTENDRLREIPYTKATLYKRMRNPRRKQLPISGSDASCFVYCDALQRKNK